MIYLDITDVIDQPTTDENSEDIGSSVLSKPTVNNEGLLLIYYNFYKLSDLIMTYYIVF